MAGPLRLLHATRGRLPSKFPCRPEVSRRGAREGLNFLVGQRRSVGYSASRISSGSRSGYSRTISSADIPFATRLTTRETVIRMPRMQARPPIRLGLNVILANIGTDPRFESSKFSINGSALASAKRGRISRLTPRCILRLRPSDQAGPKQIEKFAGVDDLGNFIVFAEMLEVAGNKECRLGSIGAFVEAVVGFVGGNS